MSEIIPTALTIVVVIGTLTFLYIIFSKNIKSHKIKIDEAESALDELLDEKHELLILTSKIIIKETDVDKKIFDDLKKIKEQNLSVFGLDEKLTDSNNLILKIADDFSGVKESDKFNEIMFSINDLDEKLEATKLFYNKYAELLNSSASKIPTNIIAKILRIEDKDFFEID